MKDRFRQARENRGLTQEGLAKLANVTQTTVYKIESGETLRPRKLDEFAGLLKVSPEWLQFGSLDDQGPSKFANIPFLNIELAAGTGFCADHERTQDLIPISKEWIVENNFSEGALKAVKVRGDSMSPRIQDGDILLVNTADIKPKSGNVYAIATDDELRVKRLVKRMDNSWIISSDNKADLSYVDEVISHHNFEQLRIIGRAVKVLMGDV